MLILGLDPGLRHTGWGLLEAEDNRLRFVACGAGTGAFAAHATRTSEDAQSLRVVRVRGRGAAWKEIVFIVGFLRV